MIRARSWLMVIAGMFAASGFIAGLLSRDDDGSAEFAAMLPVFSIHVLTYLWMKADAREIAIPSPPGATPLIVGLYPVAVPYHLIATRSGWRKAIAMCWMLAFVAVTLALNALATYLGYFLVS